MSVSLKFSEMTLSITNQTPLDLDFWVPTQTRVTEVELEIPATQCSFLTHFPVTSSNPNHKTLPFHSLSSTIVFCRYIHQHTQSPFYVSTATDSANKSKPTTGMAWTSFVATSSWRILALGGLVALQIILSKFTIKPSFFLLSGSLLIYSFFNSGNNKKIYIFLALSYWSGWLWVLFGL